MKIVNNKITLLMCILIAICTFTGCANKQKAENEYTYISEHNEIEYDNNYIQDVAYQNEKFYVLGASYINDMQINQIYIHNTEDGSDKALNIPLEENECVTKFLVNHDGNLVLYVVGVDSLEEATINQCYLIEISSTDGTIISKNDITDAMNAIEEKYVSDFKIDSEGNYYLSNGSKNILVLNKDLSVKANIPVDGYIKMMETSKDGTIFIVAIMDQRLKFMQIDLEQKSLILPENCSEINGDIQIYPSNNTSFLFGDSTTLSQFDLSTGKKSELFQWLNGDIDYEKIACLGEGTDESIWLACKNEELSEDKSPVDFIKMSKVKASDVKEKETIYYGTLFLDEVVKNAIIDFNKANEKYRIVAVDYGKDNLEDGRTKLNADLSTDQCPDIIDLASVNYAKYVSKGLFENLDSYMEKSNIHKEDYLENVFSLYEYKGNQYGIISQFNIDTLVVKSSKIGDRTGWNTNEMIDFAHESGSKTPFYNEDRKSILKYCVAYNLDDFIDSDSGKCSFDTDDFKKVLEFASEFPEESSRNEDENIATILQSDKSLLLGMNINNSFTNQLLEKVYGEDISYIGYPNKARKGNKIRAGFGCCAISSKSNNKEGAWEFLQYMISDKVQSQMTENMNHTAFPVKKSELENYLNKEAEPLGENTSIAGSFDGYPYELAASKPEDVQKIKELIQSANGLSGSYNEDIIDIILEEAVPFFEGSKSIEDTVNIIQNRAQTCINESR